MVEQIPIVSVDENLDAYRIQRLWQPFSQRRLPSDASRVQPMVIFSQER